MKYINRRMEMIITNLKLTDHKEIEVHKNNILKYMNYDLLSLSDEEQMRCDRTLPEPLLKTPVLPKNLPLTSTSKKGNVGRSEKERHL